MSWSTSNTDVPSAVIARIRTPRCRLSWVSRPAAGSSMPISLGWLPGAPPPPPALRTAPLAEVPALLGVEAGCRLVHANELGVARERSAHARELALAVAERGHGAVCALLEPEVDEGLAQGGQLPTNP